MSAVPYEVRGRGDGPPLLLLHPFPFSGAIFEDQSRLASEARLVMPDVRGFGKSADLASSPATTMETIADDALAVLDQERIAEAVVLGVSMGGYAALALAEKAPHRVRALVLADTQAKGDTSSTKAWREEAAASIDEKGTRVLVDALLARLLGPDAPPYLVQRIAESILACPAKGAAAALRGMALRPDRSHVLSAFAKPALVLVGGADVITPPSVAKEMLDLLARGELVEIAGAGHLSHFEAPEAFDGAVLEWMARLPS